MITKQDWLGFLSTHTNGIFWYRKMILGIMDGSVSENGNTAHPEFLRILNSNGLIIGPEDWRKGGLDSKWDAGTTTRLALSTKAVNKTINALRDALNDPTSEAATEVADRIAMVKNTVAGIVAKAEAYDGVSYFYFGGMEVKEFVSDGSKEYYDYLMEVKGKTPESIHNLLNEIKTDIETYQFWFANGGSKKSTRKVEGAL